MLMNMQKILKKPNYKFSFFTTHIFPNNLKFSSKVHVEGLVQNYCNYLILYKKLQ